VVVVFGAGWWFFGNFKRVQVEFVGSVRGVVILNSVGDEVVRVDENRAVWLRRGEYRIRAASGDYAVLGESFWVEEWMDLNVDVVFSSRRLDELLTSDVARSLEERIWEKYPEQRGDFVVVERRLFLRGDWYGVVLEESGISDDMATRFRVVMNRQDGVWRVVGDPEVILTVATHPDVPISVLREVNLLGR